MGLEIDCEQFESQDSDRFRDRLESSLKALEALLGQPGFGVGPASLGAEHEVALVDAGARPLPLDEEVLRETFDARMTLELDRFNLECNLLPINMTTDARIAKSDCLFHAVQPATEAFGGRPRIASLRRASAEREP